MRSALPQGHCGSDYPMMQEVAMIKRAFLVAALLACGGEPKKSPEALKLQRDVFASALAIQLHAVNYKADITTEGETANIHVGQDSVSDVRRARGARSLEGRHRGRT
jgi:hypothetical protein